MDEAEPMDIDFETSSMDEAEAMEIDEAPTPRGEIGAPGTLTG